MPQALGSVYNGYSNLLNIPDEQRIYDRDKMLMKITNERAIFSKILMENFKSRSVIAKDPTPKYKSDEDRSIALQVYQNSDTIGSGSGLEVEDRFYFDDKYAAAIEPGATILLHGIFYNGTAFATSPTATNSVPEMVRVVQKGVSNGTYTWFKVARGFQPPQGGTSGTPPNVPTTMRLTLLGAAVAAGSDEASMWSDTPFEEQNYMQLFFEKWGVDIVTKNTEIYQNVSVLERNGQRTLDLFFKKLEWMFLHGRQYYDTDGQNRPRWWSGGLIEYINKPITGSRYGTSYPINVEDFSATYGALNPTSFMTHLQNKFYFGNTNEKWYIMSGQLYTKFCAMFDNKVRIANPELTRKYGILVEDFLGSNGGVVHIVKHDPMSIHGVNPDGTNNALTGMGFIVDFEHFNYMHMQNLDLQTLLNIGQNIMVTENGIFGMIGTKRTNAFAHWQIINVN